MVKGTEFLPVSRDEMIHRGWYYYDFLVVTADGYIDHPSFGSAIIARLLEGGVIDLAQLHGGEDELLAELQRDDIRAGEHSAEF